jgi:tRNA A37 threonylcarbamoyladenosine biosynthesis protein TsaE
LEELFDGDGVSLVEWPERLRSPLPGNFRRVALHITGPSTRAIVLD